MHEYEISPIFNTHFKKPRIRAGIHDTNSLDTAIFKLRMSDTLSVTGKPRSQYYSKSINIFFYCGTPRRDKSTSVAHKNKSRSAPLSQECEPRFVRDKRTPREEKSSLYMTKRVIFRPASSKCIAARSFSQSRFARCLPRGNGRAVPVRREEGAGPNDT